MPVIKKEKIPDFLDSLLKKGFRVLAPVGTENGVNFREIKNGNEAVLDYVNTVYPPKKFFLPDGETLFTYKLGSRPEITETLEKRKSVIFGIRPCDVHGLLAMDKVFNDMFRDSYYMNRRKNTLIVAVNCAKSGENCFCQSMGTDELKEGYDILLSEAGDCFVAEGWSKRGRALMGKEFVRAKKTALMKVKNERKFDSRNIEKRVLKTFGDRRWEKVAEKCLSCGACTIVCPTCYCFSVRDEPGYEKTGERKRVWSFCMLKEFSRVAGDVVFRRDRTERCKQFIFHKLSYFMEEHGKQLCVGCGRCIDICPTGIDFFKEAEDLVKKAEGSK